MRQDSMLGNSKSICIALQDFAKALLDVADNLNRAAAAASPTAPAASASAAPAASNGPSGSESPATQSSTSSNSSSGSSSGDSQQRLQSLLEGVLMTEKQLQQVFRRFGLENFDPAGGAFDPNRHNAMLQVDDPAKEPGTVALVFKVGHSGRYRAGFRV